ncbi:PepSY domain-containing protein, partial [Ideonella sp. B508-1]|uniref:PepSY domain-containing protein n=1 Tax=Ideonella sp. B508-1 TaxID=137716 RepID=UPI00058CFC5B
MRSTRPWWVWLHRWVGLVAGLLMVLLGLSGALMVWQTELDRALNPAWLGPQALCPGADPGTARRRHAGGAAAQCPAGPARRGAGARAA